MPATRAAAAARAVAAVDAYERKDEEADVQPAEGVLANELSDEKLGLLPWAEVRQLQGELQQLQHKGQVERKSLQQQKKEMAARLAEMHQQQAEMATRLSELQQQLKAAQTSAGEAAADSAEWRRQYELEADENVQCKKRLRNVLAAVGNKRQK